VEPQQSLKSWNLEFDSNNRRSSSPSWCCGSANQNTQLHNIISQAGHHQSSHNPPLYSASYWTVAVTNGSANQNTQLHNIISQAGHHQSSHNPPLYSASYWTVAVTNPARRGKNDHHGCMNGAIN
jgi:hypothetical protein